MRSSGLLDRVFALLMAELEEADPDYVDALGEHARTVDGFADAYFERRERLGGLRALRETLRQSVASIEDQRTQHHRYAHLRGHERSEPILEHLDDDDWQTLSSKLLSVGPLFAHPPTRVRGHPGPTDPGRLILDPTRSNRLLFIEVDELPPADGGEFSVVA